MFQVISILKYFDAVAAEMEEVSKEGRSFVINPVFESKRHVVADTWGGLYFSCLSGRSDYRFITDEGRFDH